VAFPNYYSKLNDLPLSDQKLTVVSIYLDALGCEWIIKVGWYYSKRMQVSGATDILSCWLLTTPTLRTGSFKGQLGGGGGGGGKHLLLVFSCSAMPYFIGIFIIESFTSIGITQPRVAYLNNIAQNIFHKRRPPTL
jgi:hypothetical protein